MATSHTRTLQHQASTIQYCGKELSCMQHCGLFSMQAAGPVNFLPAGTQNFISTAMKSTQTPRTALQTLNVPQNGTAGDFTSCQLRNPSSNLPQGVVEASAHSSHKPTEDALQKRELRLMKNREAARECRRKKKEYVKCLENRVAVLENQNKTLIEELRALKDICRHKVK
nr:cAMP-responsive element modulator-like isoform X2 [Scatophagus argus]